MLTKIQKLSFKEIKILYFSLKFGKIIDVEILHNFKNQEMV